MDKPSLWSRLTRSQAIRAVLLYLGAAWMLLQVTETLTGLLTLPAWVGPGAVGLVLAGLVVVVATAWVQALPETTAAEEAGEVPSDWEVAPQDALASLRSGALPHLNWARALLGGVVAFSLLFGAAGVFVLVRTPANPLDPFMSNGGPAADGIAVLPFRVTGPELELYQEGMVDLVAANLDGLSDYRAIDARTVLARWHQEVGATADSDLSTALRVAAGTGARFAVVGSGVGIGPQVRFTADLYDLSDGTRVGPGAQAEGTPDAILALVDALTVDVMRSLLGDGEGEARTVRPAAMLTPSVEALRHYLRGDAAYRRGRWDEARESLELAIQEDSTFALAYWRLGETLGWSLDPMAAQGPFATALSHAERLPPRERTLLTLASAVAHFRLNTELDPLFEYVARYPDDPDGWYFLGEAGLHVSGGTGITDAMLEEALYRAVELAPTFLPYYLHALQWAAAKGQEERFEALLAEATEQGFTEEALGHPGLQWDLLHGDETQRETAAARVAALPPPDVLRWGPGLLPLVDEGLDRLASLDPVMDALNPNLESLQQSRWRWEGRYDDYRASYAADTTLLGRTLVAEMTLAQFRTGDATRSEARAVCDVLGEGSEGGGRNPHHARTECAILFGDDDDVRRHADASLRASGLVLDGFPPFLDTLGLRGSLMAYYEARQMADLGDPEAGYLHLEVALEHTIWLFETPPQLGFLAFEAERWDDAIRILEGSSRNPVFRSPAKFRLGQAYEAVGERERALDAYRTYLARMANADPGLQSVRTAREAVVRLER